jgi:DNA-binding response OmpR family regulator
MIPKILVVDDDPEFLDGVRLVLEEAGYGFIATADSKSVQQKIRSYRPNLIILDVFLSPEDNGKNIAKELKVAQDTHQIPILMISGSDQVAQMSQEARVENYLHKPFSSQQLVQTISRMI